MKMDARTGEVLWRCPLGASVRNSIAIERGKVLAQDVHGQLYAVDAETGTVSWKKDLEIGVVPPLNDGLVASQGVVYAGTGKMLWASYIGNRPSTVETSPLVAGGIVYVGASDGVIYALDAAKGTLLWKHATGVPVFASMAVSGNCLYAADFSGNVYGFACE